MLGISWAALKMIRRNFVRMFSNAKDLKVSKENTAFKEVPQSQYHRGFKKTTVLMLK